MALSPGTKMTCDKCIKDYIRLRCYDGEWLCFHCAPEAKIFQPIFLTVPTINLRNYKEKCGNVSANRIKMIKSRCIHPDGNGEVVMRDRMGRPTSKRAYNF